MFLFANGLAIAARQDFKALADTWGAPRSAGQCRRSGQPVRHNGLAAARCVFCLK